MSNKKESKKYFIIRQKAFKYSYDTKYVDSSCIKSCSYYVWYGKNSKTHKTYNFTVGNTSLETVIIQKVENTNDMEIKVFNHKYVINDISISDLHKCVENTLNLIINDIISFMNNSSSGITFNVNDHITIMFNNMIEKLQSEVLNNE